MHGPMNIKLLEILRTYPHICTIIILVLATNMSCNIFLMGTGQGIGMNRVSPRTLDS
jgi:hypothetical protein